MWSGILTGLTFLFGTLLVLSSPYYSHADSHPFGRGPAHLRWHTWSLVLGVLLLGYGVCQVLHGRRERRRMLAEARNAQVVAAFREPATPAE